MYVPDFNVQQHYQLYNRRDSQRIGEWERGSGLRSLAGLLLTLMRADHRLIMSPVFAQSLLHQMTRLPHVYLYQICREPENQRWETARGSGGRELLPLSHSLFVPAITWGPITFSSDRSPPPLLSTALPRSPALQLQKHLPLNMQSACQGIKVTYTYKCIDRRKANIYWH